MKLVLDKKHGNRIEFIASDTSISFANMIRRYSMSRVPVLAIDKVVFYDNNSAFWDEYLAHRLGLMPITTPDKFPEGGEVIFSLDAEGPKTVLSSELESSDKDISISQGQIIVGTLAQGQHLRFEGTAVIGTGKKHAKYQAGLVAYGEEDKDLRMFVESFYQMKPSEVILRGLDQIVGDLELIEAELSGKKPAKKTAEKPAKKTAEKTEAAEKPAKKTAEKTEAAEKPAKKKPAAKKKATKKAKEE
ncbi:hypothetical protein KKE92_05930 [Candidatus Micrarchaeota archaeon]|nr:hypothetical protein [Candidatus Micrarchaeota archaeon]MBU1681595.1 hypothetical protein [Candidatus Micrarchaeota archaeon]